ncbi:MAG TPA: hypothetical protein VGE46_02125 [Bdellovibrio sp.]
MKKLMGLFIAMAMSTQAMAMSNIEKVSSLSNELGIMGVQLEQAESEQKKDVIKLVISTGLATYLGIASKKMAKSGGSDIGQMYAAGFGMAGYAVTATVGIYAGVKAYDLYVNTKAIPELKASIAAKQKELEAAKKVLENLN